MTKQNIWSCPFDYMRQKAGNKNFDDKIKWSQDQGWQNQGTTIII